MRYPCQSHQTHLVGKLFSTATGLAGPLVLEVIPLPALRCSDGVGSSVKQPAENRSIADPVGLCSGEKENCFPQLSLQLLVVGFFLAWSTKVGILRLFFLLSLKSLS